jgi:glycosyltransferase involved in cell wall biosynthesis
VVFSERLRAPYDEGIKKLTVHLSAALSAEHELLVLTSDGHDDARYGVQNIDVNRALLSARLQTAIRRFQPEAIIYVPTACATLFSFARARVLRYYARDICTALVTLQPRPYTPVGKFFIRHLVSARRGQLALDWVLTQSTRTSNVLRGLGCRTALLPPAVDAERFRPPSPPEKAELRAKYGLPVTASVMTQVGHLRSKRNLDHFLALRSRASRQERGTGYQEGGGDYQASQSYHTVVVASTSTPQDADLKKALSAAGVMVIDTYVPYIEDVYRLSDLYLFLAESDTAAIELPLSVLEAMACNLPVVCTPFGGLQDFFPAGQGLLYWDGRAQLGDLVTTALSTRSATRALVEPYTWAAAAQACVRLLQDGQVVRPHTQRGTEYRLPGEERT